MKMTKENRSAYCKDLGLLTRHAIHQLVMHDFVNRSISVDIYDSKAFTIFTGTNYLGRLLTNLIGPEFEDYFEYSENDPLLSVEPRSLSYSIEVIVDELFASDYLSFERKEGVVDRILRELLRATETAVDNSTLDVGFNGVEESAVSPLPVGVIMKQSGMWSTGIPTMDAVIDELDSLHGAPHTPLADHSHAIVALFNRHYH